MNFWEKFLLDGMEKDGERSADERDKICKIIDKIERITHRLSLPQCEDYKPLLNDIRQSLKTCTREAEGFDDFCRGVSELVLSV